MTSRKLRAFAAAGACCSGLTGTALARDTHTWHWTYVTRTPNGPPLAARSSVVLAGTEMLLSYTLPYGKKLITIESCRAAVGDVEQAGAIATQGTSYLLVRFKPAHEASCASGRRPGVALPGDDPRLVASIAAAINRTCCSAVPRAAPSAPALTPPPHAGLTVWVESDGLFRFVRMRNAARQALIASGTIDNCRSVASGCGPFGPQTIRANGTATVAVVAAGDAAAPSFDFRYTVAGDARASSGSGSSGAAPPPDAARMSAAELRAAQSTALDRMRAPAAAPVPLVPPRLVKRGSSRLAIGQTGTALLRLTIDPNGTPADVTVVSITNKRLTAAAIETAVSSTYEPATQNGHPVAAKYVATFSFDGEDPALSSVPVWKRAETPTESVPSPAPSPSN